MDCVSRSAGIKNSNSTNKTSPSTRTTHLNIHLAQEQRIGFCSPEMVLLRKFPQLKYSYFLLSVTKSVY